MGMYTESIAVSLARMFIVAIKNEIELKLDDQFRGFYAV
jgi:hypothetical protein